MQNLSHRGTGDIGAFLRKTAVGKVSSGVLAVGHVHIGDDVHDAAVSFLRKAFVLAAVAGFHMENRDVKTLGADYAKATVGVSQNENSVWFGGDHQFVTLRDDIAHCLAQVCTYRVHIHLRVCKFKVFEEHAIEVVIVVLAGVCENHIKILAAFVDDRCKTDDFRTGADNNKEFEFAVILKLCHCISILLGQRKYPVFPD